MIQKGTGCFKTYGIDENINIEYIYTRNTYSGVYISNPKDIKEKEDIYLNNAIKSCNLVNINKLPYQMFIRYQKDYPNVLKTRLNIASIINNNIYKQTCIIWFDDGDLDINESLKNILTEINWNLAEEFDY